MELARKDNLLVDEPLLPNSLTNILQSSIAPKIPIWMTHLSRHNLLPKDQSGDVATRLGLIYVHVICAFFQVMIRAFVLPMKRGENMAQ